ncbi:hypothetical protein ElyMa_004926900 [Elysia marginata]|uniref:Uncharacterized protein n=1 Tax=Elysia marginata TaxID=1093978 RepID=A0AAV4IYI7_9GAST|nr:hypothetical protein ElyMa_004926900 [Elysia marginata]
MSGQRDEYRDFKAQIYELLTEPRLTCDLLIAQPAPSDGGDDDDDDDDDDDSGSVHPLQDKALRTTSPLFFVFRFSGPRISHRPHNVVAPSSCLSPS